jgi:hypothetical protein
MRASLQAVRKPLQPASFTSSWRWRSFSYTARPVLAMAASKRVLVPIGTGSEEMEAVSELARHPCCLETHLV